LPTHTCPGTVTLRTAGDAGLGSLAGWQWNERHQPCRIVGEHGIAEGEFVVGEAGLLASVPLSLGGFGDLGDDLAASMVRF
jgi:hypothetical protein